MGWVKHHFHDEICAAAEGQPPMSTLAQEVRRLAKEIWFECQHRPLCEDEVIDIECALSDLDVAIRADSDAQSDKHERAA